MQIQNNIDLTPHTTYGTPATARFFVQASNSGELVDALNFAYEQDMDFIVIGSGSNVLFAGDYDGLVIKSTSNRIEESGCMLPLITNNLAEKNIKYAENLAGIPGTLGGAVCGNAGTREGDISQIISSVTVWKDGKIKKIKNKKCEFAYRTSRFKTSGEIILAVEYVEKKAKYNVQEKHAEICEKRKTQPKGKSCGSFFKNPESDSAGRLIEECGLKGKTHGGAQISPEHANWIINLGNASSDDILKLARLCICEVEKKFGIVLEPEVKII